MLLRHIGIYQDLTVNRLIKNNDFSSYDKDSPCKIKKDYTKIVFYPLPRSSICSYIKKFFILQTLSKKMIK